MRPSQIESTVMEIRHDLVKFFEGGQYSHDSHLQPHNAGRQLRRAISIQTEGKKLLRKMLSRRQLQGFVRTPIHQIEPAQPPIFPSPEVETTDIL